MAASTDVPQYETLVLDKNENVLTIVFNRPRKLNAFNSAMYTETYEALTWAGEQDELSVVVLTGAGKYYSSGNDLTDFGSKLNSGKSMDEIMDESMSMLIKFVDAFITFPKILIAAVNGPAIGIAVTTLALCDFVYCSDTATFNTPFMELAQSPEGCSSFLFPRIMGPVRANDMLLRGVKFSAEDALECSLVSDVFPVAKFRECMHSIIAPLARMPPGSLIASKQLIRDQFIPELKATNRREVKLLRERMASAECAMAVAKFAQRKSSKL